MAAHSIRSLTEPLTGAFGLTMLLVAHTTGWPVVEGGSGIDPSTIKPYFTGTDQASIDRGVADLKASGLFSSVSAKLVDGKIVVGEGDQGAAALLYSGEIVGAGVGPEVDVALDALEGELI